MFPLNESKRIFETYTQRENTERENGGEFVNHPRFCRQHIKSLLLAYVYVCLCDHISYVLEYMFLRIHIYIYMEYILCVCVWRPSNTSRRQKRPQYVRRARNVIESRSVVWDTSTKHSELNLRHCRIVAPLVKHIIYTRKSCTISVVVSKAKHIANSHYPSKK